MNVLKGLAEVPLPPAAAEPLTYQIMSNSVSVTVPVAVAGVPAAGCR